MGKTPYTVSCGDRSLTDRATSDMNKRFECVNMTPFGLPEVPDV
jgi:hypothetical protein